MKRQPHAGVLAFCLTAALCSFQQSAAQAGDPVAEWAPEDTLLFVGVPDFDGLTQAYQKTSAYRGFQDPALSDYVQPFKKLYENARNLVAREIGLENPKDLEMWPHGGLAAYLMVDPPAEGHEEEAHFCVVADMGRDADRARELSARIVQHCLTKGAERQVEQVGGTEITTVKLKQPDPGESQESPADEAGSDRVNALLEGVELNEGQQFIAWALGQLGPPKEFAFAFAGKRLVLGTDPRTIRNALVQLRRGAEGSLASVRDVRGFKRRSEDMKTHALAVLNVPALVDGLSRLDDGTKKVVAGLNADAFGPLILAVEFAPSKELDSRLQGVLRIDSRPHGLGRILKMENIDTAPPPGVSADAAVYGSLNLNPRLILEEILAINEQIDPEHAEQMRADLTVPNEDGSELDIQSDVVNQLAGPLTFALELGRPFDSDHVNLIVRLGHKSRDAMSRLAGMLPPGMFMPGEILGHTVYEAMFMPGLAMGFTERAVIPIATRKALENFIRSEGQSGRGLAQTPGFRRAVRHVPAQSCGMIYVNGSLIYDAQIALAADGKAEQSEDETPTATTLSDYIRMGLGQGAVDAEVQKALRKYAGDYLIVITSDSEGLSFTAVGLSPADWPTRE